MSPTLTPQIYFSNKKQFKRRTFAERHKSESQGAAKANMINTNTMTPALSNQGESPLKMLFHKERLSSPLQNGDFDE